MFKVLLNSDVADLIKTNFISVILYMGFNLDSLDKLVNMAGVFIIILYNVLKIVKMYKDKPELIKRDLENME